MERCAVAGSPSGLVSRRDRRVWLAVFAVMLGACAAVDEEHLPGPNAIRIDDDLYMVPVSLDETGCQQYTAWSSHRFVPAVIHYRTADGTFTIDHSKANCG